MKTQRSQGLSWGLSLTKQEFFKHQVKKIHFLKSKYFSNFKEKKWTIIKLKNINFKSIYKNGRNNHKIWWCWNPTTKTSSTKRGYFNKKCRHW